MVFVTVLCASGGGRPETSEEPNWTSAASWTDSAKAMNEAKPYIMDNGHLHAQEQKQFFWFILIKAPFYQESIAFCVVFTVLIMMPIISEKSTDTKHCLNKMYWENLTSAWCLIILISNVLGFYLDITKTLDHCTQIKLTSWSIITLQMQNSH